MTSQPCANQDAGSSSPWQQPQPQQQQSSIINAPANTSSSALPYSPYPVAPPSASTAGPTNLNTAFQPYPGQGAPFPATTGYSAPRPAFGPPACPYPTQPSFPGPAFGQFSPAPAPYPSPYPYGGYSYPTGPHGPSTQSPTGRPLYRPGFGVPQQYSWAALCTSLCLSLITLPLVSRPSPLALPFLTPQICGLCTHPVPVWGL